MYRVSKVLNNNGVIAIDMDENKEYVILGKGVGFGKKVSQRFDKPEGCTTYRLEQETERGSAKELVKGIEPEYLEIADAILTESQKVFGDSIDRGILFPLADHISFAVARIRRNEQISNPLTEDIKVLFYSEFPIGLILKERLRSYHICIAGSSIKILTGMNQHDQEARKHAHVIQKSNTFHFILSFLFTGAGLRCV